MPGQRAIVMEISATLGQTMTFVSQLVEYKTDCNVNLYLCKIVNAILYSIFLSFHGWLSGMLAMMLAFENLCRLIVKH